MAKKANYISQRAYAKLLGVSVNAVNKAIEKQKILHGYDPVTKKINPEKADEEWGFLHKKPVDVLPDAPVWEEDEDGELDEVDEEPVFSGKTKHIKDTETYKEAIRVEQVNKARIARIKFEQLQGTLVDKAAVYSQLFEYGQQLRTAIQAVPDRCIDAIMASTTRAEAHKILYDEIESALMDLTNTKKFTFTEDGTSTE